jgi:hypothetical protein
LSSPQPGFNLNNNNGNNERSPSTTNSLNNTLNFNDLNLNSNNGDIEGGERKISGVLSFDQQQETRDSQFPESISLLRPERQISTQSTISIAGQAPGKLHVPQALLLQQKQQQSQHHEGKKNVNRKDSEAQRSSHITTDQKQDQASMPIQNIVSTAQRQLYMELDNCNSMWNAQPDLAQTRNIAQTVESVANALRALLLLSQTSG